MSSESQYTSLASVYDAIYHWKDYAAEAARLREILHAAGIPDGSRVLEASCGTGEHLRLLRERFQMEGFDLHEEMLAQARPKLPGLRLWQADMRDFEVDQPFDALLSLFSSIGYLRDEAALRQAAARFAAALRPGGLLVVEPWFVAENWDTGRPSLQTYSSPDLYLARATVAEREGDLAIMDMHWLIARRGQPVEHLVDRHEMWMCPHEQMLRVFDECGFTARFEPDGFTRGRGLFFGTRR